MAQVLSNENQLLLKTLLDRKPESLKELEVATGRSTATFPVPSISIGYRPRRNTEYALFAL
jgi:hypothetical protein